MTITLNSMALNTTHSLDYTEIKGERKIADSYIEIAGINYFIGGDNTLQSFSFKINKKGGDIAKIVFGVNAGTYEALDTVKLFIKGENVYTGFIDKIASGGKEIEVIPLWGKLMHEYVIGSLNLSSEVYIYDLIMSLKSFITNQNISFSKENINIPKDIMIETSLSGRCIADILDDCEKILPEGYNWGVDNGNNFFFKLSDEKAKRTIGFDLGSFSESTIETDYSSMFSECLVKVKQKVEDVEGMRSIGIVGRGSFKYNNFDFFYAPLKNLMEFVGKKANTKEFNILVDIEDKNALKNIFDAAYNELIYQAIPMEAKVKNINVSKYIPRILESVNIKNTPVNGIALDVLGGEREIIKTPSINKAGGQIASFGSPMGYSTPPLSENIDINLSQNRAYLDFCNRTQNITNIIIKYRATENTSVFSISDGKKHVKVFASGGFVNIALPKMKKRNIRIRLISYDAGFIYKRVIAYADFGSQEEKLVTRNIDFSYKNGTLTANAGYAKMNSVLTGFVFRQNKKLKDLEKLLEISQ